MHKLFPLLFLLFAGATFAQKNLPEGTKVTAPNYVKISDGVTLSATILQPATGTAPFPTVLLFSPYGDAMSSMDFRPAPDLLRAGYAVVVASWRGTGCSGGKLDLGTERFRQDGYELIEWIATQNWSAKVGMGGSSARGIATWHVASTQPPSLTAIAPQTFNANIFTGMTHQGGIPKFFSPLAWSLYAQPMSDIRVLRTADKTCLVNREQHSLAAVMGSMQMLSIHHDHPTYQIQSTDQHAKNVKVPTLMFLSFYDRYTPAIGSWMFNDVDAPKRMLLSNGGHGMSRTPRAVNELIRWFDYWLKGEDNGVAADEHSVGILFDISKTTKKESYVREFDSWLPKGLQNLTFELQADGKLVGGAAKKGQASYNFSDRFPDKISKPQPLGIDFSRGWQNWEKVEKDVLTYRSAPVNEDIEIVGEMELDLTLEVSTVDMDVVAVLSEELPNGNVNYIMRGALRASQRALDTTATKQHGRLIYKHTDSEPLTPHQEYQLTVGFPPLAHRVSKGTRLRLELIPIWVATAHLGWDFSPLPYAGTATIKSGGLRPSRLQIPYLPVPTDTPPAIDCTDRPNQPCRVPKSE
ncbi:MAG: CocE/NonD family hydrolase [Bacteroidota bacterium]